MPYPDAVLVEIEFTPGTWVDVTADVDFTAGIATKYGRTSEFTAPSIATATVTLNNATGTYTPGRQVLADGVTAHPYWPNVIPRRRIRYSWTVSSVTYRRFTGFIKSWSPLMVNSYLPRMVISATDRADQLSLFVMTTPIMQEIQQDNPSTVWPCTDAAGSLTAAERSGNNLPPLTVASIGAGTPLIFGDTGPGAGDGTGVKLAPASTSDGQYLRARNGSEVQWPSTPTIELWVQVAAAPTVAAAIWSLESNLPDGVGGTLTPLIVGVDTAGHPTVTFTSAFATPIAGTVSICDGSWHNVTLIRTGTSGRTFTLYIDGVSVATTTAALTLALTAALTVFNVGYAGATATAPGLLTGHVAWVAAYGTALTSTRLIAHSAATTGYRGDTVAARVQRYLGYAGLVSADWNIDADTTLVGTYPAAGKTIPDACRDMATSDGGGAAFYVAPDGRVRLTNRTYRKPGLPTLTVDAGADLFGGDYVPALDDLGLCNAATASRSAESGVLSTQTVKDQASISVNGAAATAAVTTYTLSEQDALYLAQYQVAGRTVPAFRLPKITVDLLTGTSAGLLAQVAAMEIGSRLRLTGLYAAASPTSQLDMLAEGWAETLTDVSFTVAYDASAADSPARGVWDDTTYGRWQASGMTVTAGITAAASTLQVSTTAGLPTFTVSAGAYPLSIRVGAEVFTLPTAPSGAVSPQTFTGVTRGQVGTTAAPQTTGAVVNLWPAATFAL